MKHRKNYTIIHKVTGRVFDLHGAIKTANEGCGTVFIDGENSLEYVYELENIFKSNEFIHLPFLLDIKESIVNIDTIMFLEQFEHQGNMALEDLNDLLRIEHENKSE